MMKTILVFVFSFVSFWGFSEINSTEFKAGLVPVGLKTVFAFQNDIIFLLPSEPGNWQLNRVNTQNENIWANEIIFESNENLSEAFLIDNTLILVSTRVDLNANTSELYFRSLNCESGLVSDSRFIWKKNIKPLRQEKDKAKKIANIDLELASIQKSGVEVPLTYRYYIDLSPNSEHILISFYDYSKKRLDCAIKILNKELIETAERNFEIDDSNYLYGIKISDLSYLYQVNLNFSGDLQVLEFTNESDQFELLSVTAGNSVRDDLNIRFLGDRRLLIMGKTEVDNAFYGAWYTALNFETMEVERVHFEAFPTEFKELTDSLMRVGKPLTNNWTNYALTSSYIFNDEELLLVYESFEFRRSGYVFKDIQSATNLEWKEHKAKIISGPAMIFSFDKNDELRWSKFIYKRHDSSSELFPAASSISLFDPIDESIFYYVGNNDGNFRFEMDYIYDSKSKYSLLEPNLLLGLVKTDNEIFQVYYSEQGKNLILKDLYGN